MSVADVECFQSSDSVGCVPERIGSQMTSLEKLIVYIILVLVIGLFFPNLGGNNDRPKW